MNSCKRSDKNFWLGNSWKKSKTRKEVIDFNQKLGLYLPSDQDVWIWTVYEYNPKCPACETMLIKPDIDKRRCLACRDYLRLPGEDLVDIILVRAAQNFFTYDLQDSPKSKWFVINGGEGTASAAYTAWSKSIGEKP